jgi:hypothetical protein
MSTCWYHLHFSGTKKWSNFCSKVRSIWHWNLLFQPTLMFWTNYLLHKASINNIFCGKVGYSNRQTTYKPQLSCKLVLLEQDFYELMNAEKRNLEIVQKSNIIRNVLRFLIILIEKFSDLCSKIEHNFSSVLWFVNAIKSNLISSLNQQSTHHHHLFHMALQADNLTNKVIYSYRAPHTDETLRTYCSSFLKVYVYEAFKV